MPFQIGADGRVTLAGTVVLETPGRPDMRIELPVREGAAVTPGTVLRVRLPGAAKGPMKR